MTTFNVVTLNNWKLRAGITRIRETFIKLPYCCFTYTYYIDGLRLEPPTGDVTMLHNSTAPALVFKILLQMLKAFKMAQYTVNSGKFRDMQTQQYVILPTITCNVTIFCCYLYEHFFAVVTKSNIWHLYIKKQRTVIHNQTIQIVYIL